MPLPNITLIGRVITDPELRFTGAGKAVASFRVAAQESKKNPQTNEWENGDELFVGVSVWEADAEAIAEQIVKLDNVTITGSLYERKYEDREGNKRTSLEIKWAKVSKNIRPERGQRQASSATSADPWATPTAAPAADPWATPTSGDEPPF